MDPNSHAQPSVSQVFELWGGILLVIILLTVLYFRWAGRQREISRQHELRRAARETTPGEVRTRKAVKGAIEDVLGNAPSLSNRLAQLDAALQAGQINQQEYAKKRADIIASA